MHIKPTNSGNFNTGAGNMFIPTKPNGDTMRSQALPRQGMAYGYELFFGRYDDIHYLYD